MFYYIGILYLVGIIAIGIYKYSNREEKIIYYDDIGKPLSICDICFCSWYYSSIKYVKNVPKEKMVYCYPAYTGRRVRNSCTLDDVGRIDGLYKTWDPDTKKLLRSDEYVGGRFTGNITHYYDDGKIHSVLFDDKSGFTKILSILDKKGRECLLGEGEVEVWKACQSGCGKHVYVKLLVPADAKRVTVLCNSDVVIKSRVEKAIVADIIGTDGVTRYTKAYSFIHRGSRTIYKNGEMVYPDRYNDNCYEICSHGINVHKYKDQCDYWFRPQ